jgi:trk system potassium uptake protein TrkH
MPSLLAVLSILGWLIVAFAVALLLPLATAWVGGEPAAARDAHLYGLLAALACGLLCQALFRRHRRELAPRDGVLLVVLSWTVLPLVASLPLLLYFSAVGQPISFTDAYFEAMSGLTTTGATTLTGLDALPVSINVWRCFLQWLGGMGILVLAVAILPLLGVGGSQLFRVETAGPLKDAKLTPRIAQTAKGLWSVYAGMSLLCVLAYRLGGMSWSDAWIHMFSTMSLGGLSSHDSSFGHFQSPLLDWIAVVFMLLASCNFALYFIAVRRRSLATLGTDPEMRATLAVLVGASLLVAALLWGRGVYADADVALRMAFFNVVSIASTTGYANTDYMQWPVFAPVLMLLLSGVATSAGSTGAGIKMVRVIILAKQAKREMQRMLHPRAVRPELHGGQPVPAETLFAVLAFMLLYGATIIGLTLVLVAADLSFDTAFSAVVASVNNMGPGWNEVGPAGNFQSLTDFQTWVCTLAMLLGRLEMMSVLVLFTRRFWVR